MKDDEGWNEDGMENEESSEQKAKKGMENEESSGQKAKKRENLKSRQNGT